MKKSKVRNAERKYEFKLGKPRRKAEKGKEIRGGGDKKRGVFKQQQKPENKAQSDRYHSFFLPAYCHFKGLFLFLRQCFFSHIIAAIDTVEEYSRKVHREGGGDEKDYQLTAVYPVEHIARDKQNGPFDFLRDSSVGNKDDTEKN